MQKFSSANFSLFTVFHRMFLTILNTLNNLLAGVLVDFWYIASYIPYMAMRKFWSGKIWRIAHLSPIFCPQNTSFVISCCYTCSLFTNTLHTNLVQISPFANILPLQNFPMHGIAPCLLM